MIGGIIFGINNLVNLYLFLIILRIFLTWIPSVNWENQPWHTLRAIVDPYLGIFRRIIPPIGGLDFSPIVAILMLQLLAYAVIYLLLFLR